MRRFRPFGPAAGALLSLLIGGGVLAVVTDTVRFDDQVVESDAFAVDPPPPPPDDPTAGTTQLALEVAQLSTTAGFGPWCSGPNANGLVWQPLDVLPGGTLQLDASDPVPDEDVFPVNVCVRAVTDGPANVTVQVTNLVSTEVGTPTEAECDAEDDTLFATAPCAARGELEHVVRLFHRTNDLLDLPCIDSPAEVATQRIEQARTTGWTGVRNLSTPCRLRLQYAIPSLTGVSASTYPAVQTDRLQYDLLFTATAGTP